MLLTFFFFINPKFYLTETVTIVGGLDTVGDKKKKRAKTSEETRVRTLKKNPKEIRKMLEWLLEVMDDE